MRKAYFILIILFLTFSTACYKDLGNYDYTPLSKILVDSVKKDYGFMYLFEDTLHIEPMISFGEEGNNSFEAVWYEYPDTIIPIANTLNLYLPMQKTGQQNFILELTHKELKISKRVPTTVFVTSTLEHGFYILKETLEGNTELDGHVRRGIDSYNFYPNLIASHKGEALRGKPVDLDYWDWEYNDYDNDTIVTTRVIRPVSEKDIAVLRMLDMAYLGGIPELFFDLNMEDVTFEGMKSAGESTVIFYNNGKFRVMPNKQVSRFMLDLKGDYELAPYLMSPDVGSFMVYDQLSSSFGAANATGSSFAKLPDKANPVTGWKGKVSVNNLDADLLWCGRYSANMYGFGGDKGGMYALLSKKQDPDSLFMFQMTLGHMVSTAIMNMYSPVYEIDTLSPGLSVGRGEYFSTHEDEKNLIFFTLGNRIFTYNYGTKKEDLLLNMETEFPGSSISYLRYVKNSYDPNKDYQFACLFVGSHKSGKYKLSGYEIKLGKVGEKLFELEGDGIIKDMVYAAPTTSAAPFLIYQ